MAPCIFVIPYNFPWMNSKSIYIYISWRGRNWESEDIPDIVLVIGCKSYDIEAESIVDARKLNGLSHFSEKKTRS